MQFYTPLTVIVGHNGAGKTTIIECLKYATTGDLPPNSKGGAFIHDPKLAQATEVKAQIRLAFKNVNRRDMVCIRSMSVTQKKVGVTQKTLETVLATVDDEGVKHSLSTKCAELDAEMPLQLGVSRAILDNVIFCHQEDSYWPLSEPSVLKKKFDEIFASTRYTKALDNIKTLRKEQVTKLKLAENNLSHLKVTKAKAEDVRSVLTSLQGKLIKAQERVQLLDGGEIAETVKQMEGLMEQNARAQDLGVAVKQHKLERNMKQQAMSELEQNMTVFSEDDAELKRLFREHEENAAAKEAEQQDCEVKMGRAKQKLDQLRNAQTTHLTMRGRLEGERTANERKVQERDSVVVELIAEHHYSGFDNLPLSFTDIDRFGRKIRSDVNSRLVALESVKSENKDTENSALNEIQKLKGEIASFDETKKMTRRQIESHRQKIAQHMQQTQSLKITQADVDDQQRTLADEEQQLDTAKQTYNATESDAKQRAINQELQDREFALTRVNDEMSLLNMQADTRARLSLKRTEKERKEEAASRLLAAVKAEFQKLLQNVPETREMDGEARKMVKIKQAEYKQLEEKSAKGDRKLSSIETQISMARTNLNRKTTELNDRLARLKAATGGDDFLAATAAAEEDVKEKRDEVASMRSAGAMYIKFIKKFEGNGCCPLCVRGFEEEEGAKFGSKLQTILDRIPEARKAADEELAVAEQTRDSLLNLRTVWDDAERLRDSEIPEIRKRLDEYERERETLQTTQEDSESTTALLGQEKTDAETLQRNVETAMRAQQEIDQLISEIERIHQDLSTSGSTKTMDDVQKEHEDLQLQCRNLRRDLTRLNSEARLRQTELQNRENRVRDVREQLQKSSFQLQERDKLQAVIQDLKSEIDIYQHDIIEAEASAAERLPVVREKEAELARCRQQSARVESEHSRSISTLQQSLLRLESVDLDIKRYEERGSHERLKSCEEEIRTAESQIAGINTELAVLQTEMDAIREARSDVQGLRRQIDDNLKARLLLKEVATLQAKIGRLEEKLAGCDTDSINTQYNRLKKKHDHLVGERAGLVGECKQMQAQVERLQGELRSDYKDVEIDYRRQLIELKTEEMANHDLEKYAKALENAIMKYHSMKMEEINKIIRELWVNTYQGADIDTIEIRSDADNVPGNRTYNYRVVMVKGTVSLDMRGRCSAGQKVLTSLIIRLALAETFCLNCGILALDEPTTNLDRDNIESLAESLANIIKLRRQQSNFQLVVITHDEEFMQLLGKSEYADYYWRVSKDEDGHSVITRHAILEQEEPVHFQDFE
ncbi:DNA repair protein rad50 [Thoreauomyces humboldtii]|nr:DNA repair protein rad50 [Thoreauomyces humboldtii]